MKLDSCTEKLRLQMYCRNASFYTFFFSLTNDRDKTDVKQHFFAIRRTISDVEELGVNNNDAILTMEKEICVFMNNPLGSSDEKENLRAYT